MRKILCDHCGKPLTETEASSNNIEGAINQGGDSFGSNSRIVGEYHYECLATIWKDISAMLYKASNNADRSYLIDKEKEE